MNRTILVERQRAECLFTGARFEIERSMLRGLGSGAGDPRWGCLGECLAPDDAHQRDRRRENELPSSLRD
jgi:hypothetical protein